MNDKKLSIMRWEVHPWWCPEEWQGLLAGQDCPMCSDGHLENNQHSILIARMRRSYFRLLRNQSVVGACVIILERHANELFELNAVELCEFWGDVAEAALAIHTVCSAVKINYCILGNMIPHIHCHLIPRYYGDDLAKPIKLGEHESIIEASELIHLVQRLRGNLQSGIGGHQKSGG
ncbi:HIT family protein [Deinococcus sp. QL22]|uniref:HIT family protein n=1 Tax=Deinococcus sp. QL22 TaxID=2939437 RepID=UPI002017FCE4|nr:HIT family protein [Deinococcus sp. QL22]UQN07946.1 HIT family protein [Deinococcus sp. QL22]